MSARILFWLASLLALLVTVWWLTGPDQNPDDFSNSGEYWLPELAEAVSGLERIELNYAEGASVELALGNQRWQVASEAGYPADTARLQSLMTSLARARILETKTAESQAWRHLGLNPGLQITLHDPEDFPVLFIGKYEPQRGGHFARRSDQPEAVLLDQQVRFPENPVDWMARQIVDLPQVQIKEVSIEHGDGHQVLIQKHSPDQNHFELQNLPSGRQPVSELLVDGLATFWTDLKFETVRRSKSLQRTPVLTVRTDTFAGDRLIARAHESEDQVWFEFEAVLAEASLTGVDAREAATGLEDFRARTEGWWFQIPDHRRQSIDKTLNDLIEAHGKQSQEARS